MRESAKMSPSDCELKSHNGVLNCIDVNSLSAVTEEWKEVQPHTNRDQNVSEFAAPSRNWWRVCNQTKSVLFDHTDWYRL